MKRVSLSFLSILYMAKPFRIDRKQIRLFKVQIIKYMDGILIICFGYFLMTSVTKTQAENTIIE